MKFYDVMGTELRASLQATWKTSGLGQCFPRRMRGAWLEEYVSLSKLCPSGDRTLLPFLYHIQTDTEEFIASLFVCLFVVEIESCFIYI